MMPEHTCCFRAPSWNRKVFKTFFPHFCFHLNVLTNQIAALEEPMRNVHLNENLPDTAKSVLSCGENEIWVTDAALAPTGLHVLDVVRSLDWFSNWCSKLALWLADILAFDLIGWERHFTSNNLKTCLILLPNPQENCPIRWWRLFTVQYCSNYSQMPLRNGM